MPMKFLTLALVWAILTGCSAKDVASLTCPDFGHMRRAAAVKGHFDVWVTGNASDITQPRIDRQRTLIANIREWAGKQPDKCVRAAYLSEADLWESEAADAQDALNRAPEIATARGLEKKTIDEDYEAVRRLESTIPAPPSP